MGSQEAGDGPAALLGRLDADNEHYMLVNIELRDLLEDAVTREVAMEREVEPLRREAERLRAANEQLARRLGAAEDELEALQATKLMRYSRVPRAIYGRLRHGRS